jgi:hypothetical protein
METEYKLSDGKPNGKRVPGKPKITDGGKGKSKVVSV